MRLTTTTNARSRTTVGAGWPAGWTVVAAGAGLAAIFALDRATDAAPVQHLYYLPIVLAGLWFTLAASLSTAGAAVLLYHFANAHLRTLRYGEADILQIV